MATGSQPTQARFGDFDGDDDLIGSVPSTFTGPSGAPVVEPGELKIVRAENALFETGRPLVVTSPRARGLSVADLDGDGRLDVLVADVADGTLNTILNATYLASEPFVDLGAVLPGSHGYPVQIAAGTLVGGDPFSFALHDAVPNGTAYHVVGLSRVDAPLKGGVLVPAPQLFGGPYRMDADGHVDLAGTWPMGDFGGVKVYAQFWFADPGGHVGYAASSGVEATLP